MTISIAHRDSGIITFKLGSHRTRFDTCWCDKDDDTLTYNRPKQGHSAKPDVNSELCKLDECELPGAAISKTSRVDGQELINQVLFRTYRWAFN